MDINTLITVITSLVSVIIVSILTYIFTTNAVKKERILKYKEDKYANLILSLQGFVGESGDKIKQKNDFIQEEYKSWLYSSDKVFKALSGVSKAFASGNESSEDEKASAINNALLEMRKDLLGYTRIKKEDFKYKELVLPENK